MENNKQFFLLLSVMLVSILSLTLLMGVVTVDYPTVGVPFNGTRTVNVSVTPGANDYVNATLSFTCTSPVTGASSGNISSQGNNTAGDTDFNMSWDTAAITGDCTGILRANVWLLNNSQEFTTVPGIVINNTANTVSYASSSPPSTQTTSVKDGTFSITTIEGVSSATLNIGSRSYTMTGLNDTWTYAFSKSNPVIPEGIYIGYSISVDGTGANDDVSSAGRDIWVNYESKSGTIYSVIQSESEEEEQSTSSTNAGILLLLLLGGGYLMFFRKP